MRYRFRANRDCVIQWPILTEKVHLIKGEEMEVLPPQSIGDWIALEFCMKEDALFDGRVRVV